jgi:hypothetical protein
MRIAEQHFAGRSAGHDKGNPRNFPVRPLPRVVTKLALKIVARLGGVLVDQT